MAGEYVEKRTAQGAELTPFHSWLGCCVAKWSLLESKVFDVCALALGGDYDDPFAAICFYRLNSLYEKLHLTDELLTKKLQPEPLTPGRHKPVLLRNWDRIRARITQNINYRNFLVHHPVGYAAEDTNWKGTIVGINFLASAQIDQTSPAKKRKADPIGPVTLAKLREHHRIVAWILTDLSDYLPLLHAELHK